MRRRERGTPTTTADSDRDGDDGIGVSGDATNDTSQYPALLSTRSARSALRFMASCEVRLQVPGVGSVVPVVYGKVSAPAGSTYRRGAGTVALRALCGPRDVAVASSPQARRVSNDPVQNHC